MSDLLVFGDSFPAGAELFNLEDRFPVLIAKQLKRNLIDLSKGATSIDHMVLELMHFLKNNQITNNCIALVCITDPCRTLYFENSCPVELTPHTNSEVSNTYFKHIHSNELEKFNWERNIAYMNYAFRCHNIKAFFINNWNHPYDLAGLVDISYNQSICEMLGSTTREWDGRVGINPFAEERKTTRNKYFAPRYHPNVEGHKLIAQQLINWIEKHE